jgi:two-component system, NarL family, sensor kinase
MHQSRLYTILVAIIFVLPANKLAAQIDYYTNLFQQQKDSLVKELAKHPQPDTVRVDALIRVIDCAIFFSQRKQLLPYWQEALQLSRHLKYRQGEADCLEWRGSYYKSAQKNDSANIYLDSAIVMAGNAADKWLKQIKGFALFEKGMMYEFQENFYTALNNYFESLRIFNGTDLRKQKMICLRVADIYQKLHNDEKALEYYEQALKFYEASNPTVINTEAEGIYILIAGIYFNKGDLSTAGLYLNKLTPSMPDTAETMESGAYYHLAGLIALKEKKPDSAIILLKEALKYFGYTKQMHEDEIANVCADLATLSIEKSDLSEAKKYTGESIASAKLSGRNKTIAASLTVMAQYYSKTGNPAGAYQALHQATVLNDSVLAQSNIKQAATLAAIYENSKKEKEISQLEADKQVQTATLQQKSLLNIIFIIAILALLIISSVLYINFKNKQKIEQQKIAELEKEKQLMGIEAMLKGQEEERSRLAKDLHDGLGGMLSGVKISFSNMKENLIMDDTNARAFEKSIQQLDLTIAELRKVAHNLMPEALVKFGLKSAVKDFCESMQLTGTTQIICEQFGSERELGNIADVNVYRIIQELVNNAVLHGNASQVLVQLTKSENKVLIAVEDNGKGFDTNSTEKPRGIGLSNIQSRVNYFNGKMDIDSKPGEGTTFNIELMA